MSAPKSKRALSENAEAWETTMLPALASARAKISDRDVRPEETKLYARGELRTRKKFLDYLLSLDSRDQPAELLTANPRARLEIEEAML